MKPMIPLAALLLIATVSWSEASAQETVPWNTGVAVTYDGSGNIKQVGTDLYRYDVAGRLLRSDANGARWNYTYDAYGNRQTCTVVSTNSDCQGVSVNSANNRLSAPAVYDNAGNVTSLNSRTYSYDALNMQTRDSGTGVTVEYVYTADDERIAVYTTTTGAWRWTLRGASAKVLRELTSADVAGGTVGAGSWAWVKDYVWRDDLLLATRQREQAGQSPTTYHYHLDHLGTPRRITNDNDTIVGVHDYHAFGTELSTGTNEPSHTPLQFTGHERDGTLDYMHARFYQAGLGRFLSADPGRAWDLHHPQSWNLYGYVLNDPLNMFDPTGLCDERANFIGPRTPCAPVSAEVKPTVYWATMTVRSTPLEFTVFDRFLLHLIASMRSDPWVELAHGMASENETQVRLAQVQFLHMAATGFMMGSSNWGDDVDGPGAGTTWTNPAKYETRVTRWMSEAEYRQFKSSGTLQIGGGGRTYVTALGAPRPGGTGPVRVDFNVPTGALERAGVENWYFIGDYSRPPVTGITRH